jgi:hypothetical protein
VFESYNTQVQQTLFLTASPRAQEWEEDGENNEKKSLSPQSVCVCVQLMYVYTQLLDNKLDVGAKAYNKFSLSLSLSFARSFHEHKRRCCMLTLTWYFAAFMGTEKREFFALSLLFMPQHKEQFRVPKKSFFSGTHSLNQIFVVVVSFCSDDALFPFRLSEGSSNNNKEETRERSGERERRVKL